MPPFARLPAATGIKSAERCDVVRFIYLCSCTRLHKHKFYGISSAQCIRSLWQTDYKISLCVSESVIKWNETSWTLYRSQSSTDLHQTCQQGKSPGDGVAYWFLVEIRKTHVRQTGNGINFHHCSYGKIALMSNIPKTVIDITMGSMEVEYETTPGMEPRTLTLDDLELG